MNRENIQGIVQTWALSQLDYDGRIDRAKILGAIGDNPKLKDLAEQALARFNGLSRPRPRENIEDMVTKLNDWNREFYGYCKEFYEDYRSDQNKKCALMAGLYCVRRTRYAQELFADFQKKLKSRYDELTGTLSGRFFITKHFKKKMFLFRSDTAKRCATGYAERDFQREVDEEDVKKAKDQFAQLMVKELKKGKEQRKKIDLGNAENHSGEMKDVLKFRPHLVGNYLDRFEGGFRDVQKLAEYICKKSLEVYSRDALWSGVSWGLWAVVLASTTVLLTPAGGGAIASTAGVVGTVSGTAGTLAKGHTTVLAIDDILKTKQGVYAGVATGDVGNERLREQEEKMAGQKKVVVIDGALTAVGLHGVSKGLRGVWGMRKALSMKRFFGTSAGRSVQRELGGRIKRARAIFAREGRSKKFIEESKKIEKQIRKKISEDSVKASLAEGDVEFLILHYDITLG